MSTPSPPLDFTRSASVSPEPELNTESDLRDTEENATNDVNDTNHTEEGSDTLTQSYYAAPTETPADSDLRPCRYFPDCRKGDECTFLHDLDKCEDARQRRLEYQRQRQRQRQHSRPRARAPMYGSGSQVQEWTSVGNESWHTVPHHQYRQHHNNHNHRNNRDNRGYKTRLCRHYMDQETGCRFPREECRYAHGEHDLMYDNSDYSQSRPRRDPASHPRYKTMMCRHDACPYAERCVFAHSEDELRPVYE